MKRWARALAAFLALELIVVLFDSVSGTHLFLLAAQPLVLLALISYLD